jgi:signal transduction histidine kinase
LLGAEIARIEGRECDAIELCEQAIEFAAAGPLLQYHALAHELCARMCQQRDQPSLAAMHLAQARERYTQWGAAAKVDAMERQYPGLARRDGVPAVGRGAPQGLDAPGLGPAGSLRHDAADGLDLFSVLKAAQAIAGEVELSALLARLMHIAIENAGAERGALVLESDAGPLVHAIDAIAHEWQSVEQGVALERSDSVPIGIVNYVRRTAESVVLAQAETDEQHATDPYVVRHRPRSVVCVPVQKQGRAIGVLYLEHRRAGAVFTPQRLRTLRILATQAAISLENARLVGGLKQEITERRQAQAQLGGALAEVERLKEDLEAENSYLRRDLIANVSHDLRTPLVSMRGYLELLAAKGETLDPDQRREYLGIAVRQSEHLTALVDELFELAKLDFKGMTLEREPFPFGELATDVVQKFRLAAERKRVGLHVEAAPHLPFVNADLSLMERVLENLIGNALQHTPAGGQVCVRLSAEGMRLSAQVADTGSGIPSADLPFIFDRFYRGADGRTRTSGGAGLGLAITKRILELHDTEIRVESDAKSGTRFAFSLPLHAAPG